MTAKLERRELDRLRELTDELSILRLGLSSATTATMIQKIRDLVELDSVTLYTLRNRTGRWEIDRWESCGLMREAQPLIRSMFNEASEFPLYYNPLSPPRGQRNRVVDAFVWINASQPGTWERHPMAVQVLRPLRATRWHQPRALLCKGPTLLGWFGGMDPEPPAKRQLALLSRLVRPMTDRLHAESRLSEEVFLRPAFEAMLDRVGTAAFLIDRKGVIQESNTAGRAMLAVRGSDLRVSLRRATTHPAEELGVELIPVAHGEWRAWIAVIQSHSPDARIDRCVATCAKRWSLTPRQNEVLGHVVRGNSNTTISTLLGCVERTVELHVTAIFDRAGIESRSALVAAVLTSIP